MNNSEAIKLSGAVVTTGKALVVSRIDAVEQFFTHGRQCRRYPERLHCNCFLYVGIPAR